MGTSLLILFIRSFKEVFYKSPHPPDYLFIWERRTYKVVFERKFCLKLNFFLWWDF